MRRAQRLIAATVLIALSGALSGCGGGGMSGFDPSDLLDFLDTKKKLPGERKAVFPEGVPGLQQGVPKELYRGAAAEPAPEVALPPAEEPRGKSATKARAKGRAGSPAPAAATPADPDAAPAEEGSTAAAPPAPKGQKISRRRTTAPPPDAAPAAASAQQAQPAQSAFPAPLPSGGFSR